MISVPLFIILLLGMTGLSSQVLADNTTQLGVPFQLGFNQTATTDQGLLIKFVNMTDSRCPSDVTCIWQGQAKLLLNIKMNNKDFGNFTLISGNDKKLTSQTFDHYYVQLMKVEPYPISTKNIHLSDYVVTLKLSLFPPLKQLKAGISQSELICMQSFTLVIKSEDNSPACIKPDSIPKLVARGWALSNTQPILGSGNGQNQIITLEQSGQIIHLHKGDNFLLKLGKNSEWNIAIDNQTVLNRVPNIMVMEDAQGIFVARDFGETKLSAVGNPWCLYSEIPCKIHSILFEMKVVVSS